MREMQRKRTGNMESKKEKRVSFGGSLKVKNVQALASMGLKKYVPPQYIRDELEFDEIYFDESLQISVIDMANLDRIDPSSFIEDAKIGVINHGTFEVVEKMKVVSEEFSRLLLEKKMQSGQHSDDIEGYGQSNVFSADQKLDWADKLGIITRPLSIRNMKFWPTSPISYRSTVDAYSSEMEKVSMRLLRLIAKNLGVDPSEFLASFENELQAVRLNYYPPCELANKVIGFTPHSDALGLTLLVQVNDMQGLQIKKNDKWIPIKPLPGAIIVNIGDIIEIMSNGEDNSIEHRAMVNADHERMSIAAFHNLNMKATVGPIPSLLVEKNQVAKYNTIFTRLFKIVCQQQT